MRFRQRVLFVFAVTAAFSLALRWLDPTEERHLDSSAVQGRWTAQEMDGLPIVVGEIEFAPRVLRDVVIGEDIGVFVEDGLMVWVAKGHEVIFVRA